MSDPLVSPRARRLAPPRWLDTRLLLGVLLVLVSVVVGARVLSSADRSQLVWAASKDLTVGSSLGEDDLEAVRVRLFDNGVEYLRAQGAPPVGYVLRRAVGAGELLPEQSLGRPGRDVDLRLVTVPVESGHYPPTLRADQRVDLWVTPTTDGSGPAPEAVAAPEAASPPAAGAETAAGATATATATAATADGPPGRPLQGAQQVLSQVAVHTGPPDEDLASSGTVPVVLVVRPDQVSEVVSAIGLGRLDLVRVPREAETSGELTAPVEAG